MKQTEKQDVKPLDIENPPKYKQKLDEQLQDDYEEESQEQEEELIEDDEGEDCMQKYKLSPQKLGKLALLCLMMVAIVGLLWMSLDSFLFSAKTFTKTTGSSSEEEYAAIDEEGWRSYYYFKQMQEMARLNVANGRKIDLSLVMNRFGDITFSQLLGLFKVLKSIQYAKGYNTSLESEKDKQDYQSPVDQEALLKAYNYKSYFLPAANQFSCASCYSFPITATIEYIYKKYKNITVKLSEQQLIDCSAEDDLIDGCSAGNITKGFLYAVNLGLVEQDAYPYRSKGGHSYPCRKEVVDDPSIKKYKIGGFRTLPTQNCQAIQAQLSLGNAVASMLAIDPSQLSNFREQDGRPYRNCPKEPFNHAITIVGQTDKQDWIVRNSWGISWGDNGYFTLRGGDTCGVCRFALVPYF